MRKKQWQGGLIADNWLDRATGRIRFSRDRAAVREELAAHIQDREERYLAAGLSAGEARAAALKDMGDAEELAVQLGKIHAPWWGYIWRLSRWALVIAAVMLCFRLYEELQPWGKLRSGFTPYEPQVGDVSTWASGRTSETLSVWEPEGSVELGGYRITVPCAFLERHESFTYEDGTSSDAYYELTVWIKATTWRFWEPLRADQSMILDHVAADSSGSRYAWDPQRDPEEIHSLFCHSYSNPLSTWFAVYLDLPDETVPDWVEIPLGFGGDIIRVDLKEEVVG